LLTGKRILITGANGGIGQSLCEILLQNNAKLVLFYHEKRTQIDNLLKKYGDSNIQIYQVDLMDSKKLDEVMNSVTSSGQIKELRICNGKIINHILMCKQDHFFI
jgi:FlaA1/EpsC-like NDP-sugar epimerase